MIVQFFQEVQRIVSIGAIAIRKATKDVEYVRRWVVNASFLPINILGFSEIL